MTPPGYGDRRPHRGGHDLRGQRRIDDGHDTDHDVHRITGAVFKWALVASGPSFTVGVVGVTTQDVRQPP